MSKATTRPSTGSHRIVEALGALRRRNYRLYWFGQISSVLAQNMEGIAQSWLVLELTNSPLLLGLTGLAFAIPTITLTLLGGVVADRADRRRIMIFSQLGSASIFLILATLVIAGWIALWQVMTLAFLSGCIRAFDRPSRMALLPQMVPKGDIPNAVAVGGTIWQLNRLAGPAVAGPLIYLIGIRTNLLFLLLCVAERGLLVGRYPFRASAHRSLLRRPLAAHDGRTELYLEERDLLYLHQHDLLQQRLWHVLSNSDAGVRAGRTHCGLPRLRLFAKRGGFGSALRRPRRRLFFPLPRQRPASHRRRHHIRYPAHLLCAFEVVSSLADSGLLPRYRQSVLHHGDQRDPAS